jgi:inosine-uridine nucleoside N-ribohydrolase
MSRIIFLILLLMGNCIYGQNNKSKVLSEEKSLAPEAKTSIPVILDTDAGSDIDDIWALAQLLRSSELDLKLVLSSNGDARYRAKVICNFLEASQRNDVPVGIGLDQGGGEKYQTVRWLVENYELKKYPGPLFEDGIAQLIDIVMKSPELVTIITIGPATNIAEAIKREPLIAAKCRLVGMYGSFGAKGIEPSVETNVKNDIPAFRALLSCPWREILLTPLELAPDIKGDNYHSIWCADDPMLRSVIQNYCIFAQAAIWGHFDFFTTRSTALFDCVAIYLACEEELVEIEDITFNVTDLGLTPRMADGQFKARVALRWKNQPLFETYLTERLLGYHVR